MSGSSEDPGAGRLAFGAILAAGPAHPEICRRRAELHLLPPRPACWIPGRGPEWRICGPVFPFFVFLTYPTRLTRPTWVHILAVPHGCRIESGTTDNA
jgi:hypothetical protein